MSEFKNKVVIITGSTAGLGVSVAEEFAKEGAIPIISGRREKEGRIISERIQNTYNVPAIFVQCDVSVSLDVKKLIDVTLENHGRIDFAINNAAIGGQTKRLADYDESVFDDVIGVNLKGTFLCMKYEIPEILKTGGAIVNVSSISGHRGQKHGIAPYSATKHGIVGLTKCAALEYGGEGLRINVVCPAGMETEMNESLYSQYPDPEKAKAERNKSYPLGRIARPSEVAQTIIWLCSSKASFLTGALIPVDGGKTA